MPSRWRRTQTLSAGSSGMTTTDSILFLRTRAISCREAAAGVNPCGDTDDSAKGVLLDHAKQYDAAADEIDRLRGDVSDWRPIETAPKDMKILALFEIDDCEPIVDMVYWDDTEYPSGDEPSWVIATECRCPISRPTAGYTKWQPLPEPPK